MVEIQKAMTVPGRFRYCTAILAALLFVSGQRVCSQVTDFPDTILIPPDTLIPPSIDTSKVDTVSPLGGVLETRSPSGIDSVVTYAADDSIVFPARGSPGVRVCDRPDS